MYEVIVSFTDLADGRHVYRVGDEYPRSGVKVDTARVKELLGEKNKLGKPLIKHTGKVIDIPAPVEEVKPEVEVEAKEKPKSVNKKRRGKDVAREDS